jgi:hypothetical protein
MYHYLDVKSARPMWCPGQKNREEPLLFFHSHHHQPINVSYYGAQAFLVDYTYTHISSMDVVKGNNRINSTHT